MPVLNVRRLSDSPFVVQLHRCVKGVIDRMSLDRECCEEGGRTDSKLVVGALLERSSSNIRWRSMKIHRGGNRALVPEREDISDIA